MKFFENLKLGGFITDSDVFEETSKQIAQVADFAAKQGGRNYISSGVENLGNNQYSQGWIVWNFEPLTFQGGAFNEKVSILEDKQKRAYTDGVEHDYTINRYAVFGTHPEAVATFDFSDLQPAYAKFANGFLKGVLLPYTGLLSDIPRGFKIVEAMRGRVFKSIGDGEGQDEIGAIGGSDWRKLELNQLPKFTPTGSVSKIDSQTKNIPGQRGGDNSDNSNTGRFAGADKSPNETGFNFEISVETFSEVTPTITMSEIGGDQEFDNRMAFLKGAYITWVGFN